MDKIDIQERSKKMLNNAVAISVVLFSLFTAVMKIKDDNFVQAMQAAKADAVDTWNDYQATRIKEHLAENTILTIRSQANLEGSEAQSAITELGKSIGKYQTRSKELLEKAKRYESQYDALNFRDDQFDLSDAFMAVSISMAAVTALVELWWLLWASWMTAAIGMVMGLAGFNGWAIHPGWVISLLT
jgi:hypothetical protein